MYRIVHSPWEIQASSRAPFATALNLSNGAWWILSRRSAAQVLKPKFLSRRRSELYLLISNFITTKYGNEIINRDGDSSRWHNAILTSECSQLESLKPFDREKMAWGGQSCRLQDLKFRSEVLTCCLNSNLLASTGRSPVPLTKSIDKVTLSHGNASPLIGRFCW